MERRAMIPARGIISAQTRSSPDYAKLISAALREHLGASHRAIKTAMQWTGASEKTVKNWFAGTNGPCGEHLIALVSHSDNVMVAVLTMAGRRDIAVSGHLIDLRHRLAETLGFIDSLSSPKYRRF
jgi:hypothetical protein